MKRRARRHCRRRPERAPRGGAGLRFVAAAEFGRFAAVQLFLEAARRAGADDMAHRDLDAAARIARALHGVPLALELAASWTSLLTCREIAERLERGLDLLATTAPDVPERHRCLRNAFEGSWRLLDAADRRCFARLALFHSGFDAEGARRVAGADLPRLRSLASWLLVSRTAPGRYAIHPALRHFALEKLDELRERGDARRAHAGYYVDVLRCWEDASDAVSARPRLERLALELDDLRDAWRHARGGPEELARVLDKLAVLAHEGGDDAEALALLHRALEVRERSGDAAAVATSLNNLGTMSFSIGDLDGADGFCSRSLALQRAADDGKAAAISLQNLASIAFAQGRLEHAEQVLAEGLALARSSDAPATAAIFLGNLGRAAAVRRDPASAGTYLLEAIACALDAGTEALALEFLPPLAQLLDGAGALEHAIELCVLQLEHPLAVPQLRADAEAHLLDLARRVDTEAAARAQARGAMLGLRHLGPPWLPHLRPAATATERDGTGGVVRDDA